MSHCTIDEEGVKLYDPDYKPRWVSNPSSKELWVELDEERDLMNIILKRGKDPRKKFDRNISKKKVDLFLKLKVIWLEIKDLMLYANKEDVLDAIGDCKELLALVALREERKSVIPKATLVTQDFLEQGVTQSNTKEKLFRRLGRKAKKNERFHQSWERQKDITKLPDKALACLLPHYMDCWSRICTIEKKGAKRVGGNIYNEFSVLYVGADLKRICQYIAEEDGVEVVPEFAELLKEVSVNCQKKIDRDFCEGEFIFQDYIFNSETLTLHDIRTINLVRRIPSIMPVFRKSDVPGFISTLAVDPWLRASKNTWRFIWGVMMDRVVEILERKTSLTLAGVHLGRIIQEPYVRFQLASDTNDEKWHTADTEEVALLLAEQAGTTITKLEKVEPNKAKSFEIRDGRGFEIPAVLAETGDWFCSEKGTATAIHMRKLKQKFKPLLQLDK